MESIIEFLIALINFILQILPWVNESESNQEIITSVIASDRIGKYLREYTNPNKQHLHNNIRHDFANRGKFILRRCVEAQSIISQSLPIFYLLILLNDVRKNNAKNRELVHVAKRFHQGTVSQELITSSISKCYIIKRVRSVLRLSDKDSYYQDREVKDGVGATCACIYALLSRIYTFFRIRLTSKGGSSHCRNGRMHMLSRRF